MMLKHVSVSQLKHVNVRQWVRQTQTRLTSSWPRGLRVINEQLWCCCGDAGIVIVDSELQQQQQQLSMSSADMGNVYDVAGMSNGDVVIVASNGLYHRCNGMWHWT